MPLFNFIAGAAAMAYIKDKKFRSFSNETLKKVANNVQKIIMPETKAGKESKNVES